MKLFVALAPEDKEKLDFLVDTVHRVGVVRDNSIRPVIIQFTMRAFRIKIWKVSRDNNTLKEKKLFLKEDLTQADRMERNRLWPIVEEARKQGKRAGFRGPHVYIEGKKEFSLKLDFLKAKYNNPILIIGGDFNDVSDDTVDRLPPRFTSISFKPTEFLSANYHLTDVWRYMNPDATQYTWSNSSRSSRSRIDLWLMSTHGLQYVTDVSYSHAPLSDHKLISLRLKGVKEQPSIRGYWKFNNDLLDDRKLKESVSFLVEKTFKEREMDPIQKWEFFKYKVQETAIKCCKEIKKQSTNKMQNLIVKLEPLISKQDLSESELRALSNLKDELDKMYVNLAKGAFIRSRAKWLEKGEKN
uniref:Endonuclease/exonuclease/phosphatase domain-containing protein n=1 Tax=Nothobranchius furzeri TaxID=105023 RepID=A0A1A8VGD5_NOTFU